ncbi:FecR domain-containing protein [Mucilaginibacter gracilis]|uniref:FecR domain-containing protein n=1 Tax=Mucilaginibacter gracilis TaxID=423350 RepID=UPI0037430482
MFLNQFKNEELKTLGFTAVFKRETLGRALKAMRLTEDFNYEKRDSVICILK